MRRFLPILAMLLVACPGFEDRFSGTYRQVASSGEPGAEPVAVEIFRYGHNVQALVRFYEKGDSDFSNERRCSWTEPAKLSEDNAFEVLITNTSLGGRLAGRFEDNGDLKARINTADGNSPDLQLVSITDVPDDTCRTIPPRTVLAQFGGLSATNEFAPGEYSIQNPYFGIQWIAVQPVETGTIDVWTAFTPDLVFAPIQTKVTANRRGLTGGLPPRVQPPADDYRTVSGDTRYSLAHFIVVDDDPEDDSFVSWDPATEPIIASGVRRGTRLGAPAWAEQHDQYGRALLFVEGSLDDLGPNMLALIEGEEDVDPDQHFYVVELFAHIDQVNGMRLDGGTQLTIPVTVTTDYLEDTTLPLPPLFPQE